MAPFDTQSLTELAKQYGLGESYYDYRGTHRIFSDAARIAILQSMGATERRETVRARPVYVRTQEELFCDLQLPQDVRNGTMQLEVLTEAGECLSITHDIQHLQQPDAQHHRAPLPADLPQGYHRLNVHLDQRHYASSALIITPTQCYEPAQLQQGRRLWGLSIQLYTLRSPCNWGIGDFADLKALIRTASVQGCDTIGLNPLHALRPADPAHISPYSPSSREFLNVLYISVTDVAEFSECEPAQRLMAAYELQLQALRVSSVVSYSEVAALKFEILTALHQVFREQHIRLNSERARQFQDFINLRGDGLRLHALYDALDQHFTAAGHHWGWRSWPAAYHDPSYEAVQTFAHAHAERIEFFMYLQWLAYDQLQAAQQLARDLGMVIGIYGDVAVGVDPNGSEVWGNRSLYVDNVAVGAPPDPLALKGQDWGIPPQHPLQLMLQAYQPFIRMLYANMRAAGALRIDHVMTLCRLWWVPRGFESTEGVYVHYPLDDLMKIVALESQRNHCLVIGEDLGTVPDAMRHAMERFALYHYKVLFFEKAQDGQFIAPHDYPQRALAVVTTHDLPPFKSWWQSDDIALRDRLNLYPDATIRAQVHQEREQDRRLLMQALTRTHLWYWQTHEAVPPYSFALMRAAYLYTALSKSALLVVQPEDLQNMIDPVNVPGTSTEHANWQRKLDADLADTLARPEVKEFMQAMSKARRGENPNA